MAAQAYDKTRELFLDGQIDLRAVNVKAVLVLTGGGHYVVNAATHQFLSDISAGDRVAFSPNLSGKTTTGGVFDASDFTFTSVAAGPACGAIVFYVDTGVAGTSALISYHDDYAGLPVTPNGGDINVTLDNGANRIFKF